MLWECIPRRCFLRFFVPLFPRTRYQYYLQVKKDVLEGRLRCTLEQVIRLAGLAVQGKGSDGPGRSPLICSAVVLLGSRGESGIYLKIPGNSPHRPPPPFFIFG